MCVSRLVPYFFFTFTFERPLQLIEVAEGLIYLHDRGIVHGNLNGVRAYLKVTLRAKLIRLQSNILIDSNGRARLAGFSLLTITPDEPAVDSSDSPDNTTRWAGSVQWSAPEVLTGKAFSKGTDVFSFAMVMVEVRQGPSTMGQSLVTFVSHRIGFQRNDSVRRCKRCGGHLHHNARQPPHTAEKPVRHGRVVEVDPTMLGWTLPLAPRSFGDFENSPCLVSLPFIPAVICS